MIVVHGGRSLGHLVQYLPWHSSAEFHNADMQADEQHVQFLAPRVGTIRKGKIAILTTLGLAFTINIRVNGVAVLTKAIPAGTPDLTVHDIPGQAVFAFSPAEVAHLSVEMVTAAPPGVGDIRIQVSYDIGR